MPNFLYMQQITRNLINGEKWESEEVAYDGQDTRRSITVHKNGQCATLGDTGDKRNCWPHLLALRMAEGATSPEMATRDSSSSGQRQVSAKARVSVSQNLFTKIVVPEGILKMSNSLFNTLSRQLYILESRRHDWFCTPLLKRGQTDSRHWMDICRMDEWINEQKAVSEYGVEEMSIGLH